VSADAIQHHLAEVSDTIAAHSHAAAGTREATVLGLARVAQHQLNERLAVVRGGAVDPHAQIIGSAPAIAKRSA